MTVRRSVNVAGVTSTEFDGVSAATLRYWYGWWCSPERTPSGEEERGRSAAVEARKLWHDLDARYHAGGLRKPAPPPCWDRKESSGEG